MLLFVEWQLDDVVDVVRDPVLMDLLDSWNNIDLAKLDSWNNIDLAKQYLLIDCVHDTTSNCFSLRIVYQVVLVAGTRVDLVSSTQNALQGSDALTTRARISLSRLHFDVLK